MRVTLSMMTGQVLNNLTSSVDGLLNAQIRASSGKRIQRPSDDVSGTAQAMRMRSAMSKIDQFGRNSSVAKNQLSMTNDALNTVVNSLRTVRDLALSAGSSALSNEARDAINAQLDTIKSTLVATANTQQGGKYLFSGGSIDKPALAVTPGTVPTYAYQGDNAQYTVQIAPGTYVTGNVTADQVFNIGGVAKSTSPDLLTTIDRLRNDITNGSVDAISQRVADVSANLDNVIAIRSQVGGRIARITVTNNMMLDTKTGLKELLSDTEDMDMAEAAVDLQTRQTVYQAATATASRVLQVSLADYLK